MGYTNSIEDDKSLAKEHVTSSGKAEGRVMNAQFESGTTCKTSHLYKTYQTRYRQKGAVIQTGAFWERKIEQTTDKERRTRRK